MENSRCGRTHQEGHCGSVIVKHWRLHKCPPAQKGYIVSPVCSMEYRVARKRNETELDVRTWIDLHENKSETALARVP